MRISSTKGIPILAPTLIALLSMCGCRKSQLSERPIEQPGPPIETKEESTVTVNALLPYSMLSEAVTSAIPDTVVIPPGRQNVCMDVPGLVEKKVEKVVGGDVGKFLGTITKIWVNVTVPGSNHLCLDVDYQGTVRREGPITFSPNQDSFRLSVPIRVDGQAGFTGLLADALLVNRKNFRGAITAFADVQARVDENWNPTVSVAPDFVWRNNSELEVAGKFWINIDGTAGPELKRTMNTAASTIQGLITRDKLRAIIQPTWHKHEIQIPGLGGQSCSLSISPRRVGFSGIKYTPDGIQLALMVTAETEVLVKPEDGRSNAQPTGVQHSPDLPLPKLETIPAQQNSFKLCLPITFNYKSIESLTSSALVGKTFEETRGGNSGSISVKEVKVYPAGERLVVGLRFDSKISKPKSLAPNGWVYLVAKPSLDLSTQTLSLSEIGFSRIIDNDLWNLISFLFQGQIRKVIEERVRLDLRPQIEEGKKQLVKNFTTVSEREGILIVLNDTSLALSKIALTDKGVQVGLALGGSASLTVKHARVK